MKTEPIKNPRSLLEVERLVYHAQRPGFQIAELHLSPSQKVPWHSHTEVQNLLRSLHGACVYLCGTQRKRLPGTRENLRSGPRRPPL